MAKQDSLVIVVGVGAQRLFQAGGVDAVGLAEIQAVRDDAQPLGHLGPAIAEAPGDADQDLFPGAGDIAQAGFPGAVTIGDVNCDLVIRAGNGGQVGDHGPHHVDDRAFVDVRRRAMHRLKDRIGHDRGTGNGKVGAACGKGHLAPVICS